MEGMSVIDWIKNNPTAFGTWLGTVAAAFALVWNRHAAFKKERCHRLQLQKNIIADVAEKHARHKPNPAICNCLRCMGKRETKGKH